MTYFGGLERIRSARTKLESFPTNYWTALLNWWSFLKSEPKGYVTTAPSSSSLRLPLRLSLFASHPPASCVCLCPTHVQWKLWAAADTRASMQPQWERLTTRGSVQWRTSCLFGYRPDKHRGPDGPWDPSWLLWENGISAQCNLLPRPQAALWSALGRSHYSVTAHWRDSSE